MRRAPAARSDRNARGRTDGWKRRRKDSDHGGPRGLSVDRGPTAIESIGAAARRAASRRAESIEKRPGAGSRAEQIRSKRRERASVGAVADARRPTRGRRDRAPAERPWSVEPTNRTATAVAQGIQKEPINAKRGNGSDGREVETRTRVGRAERGDDNRNVGTEWHRIVYWARGRAKSHAKLRPYMRKGREVLVVGRIRTGEWDRDGEKVTRKEIIAESVDLTGGGHRAATPASEPSATAGDGQTQSRRKPSAPGRPRIGTPKRARNGAADAAGRRGRRRRYPVLGTDRRSAPTREPGPRR